jgi:hypothetical protein
MTMNIVIFTSVDNVQSSILELQRSLSPLASLTTPFPSERVFYPQDAIGRVSTITLDSIISYDALIAVIQVRFEGIPGLKKILKRECALQNRATGEDVDAT